MGERQQQQAGTAPSVLCSNAALICISDSMESPLEQLLRAAVSECAEHDGFNSVEHAIAVISSCMNSSLSRELSDVLRVLLSGDVQGCVSDASTVQSCKERGGAAFQRCQLPQALALFSEALKFCDETTHEGSKLAARLYCNRALCLLRLQPASRAQAAAAENAACGIACDPSWDKAWYRAACAHQALGDVAAALQHARQALQLQQEQQQGAGDSAELSVLIAALEAQATGQQAVQEQAQADSAAGTANGHADDLEAVGPAAASTEDLVTAAAPQLCMQDAGTAGRCLAAAEAVPAGLDVLREQPFAHVLTKQGRRSCCAVCCKPLGEVLTAFYCKRCPLASYCSAACREADLWHAPGGPECGGAGPWTLLLPAEAVLALRLVRRLKADVGTAAGQLVASLQTHWADLPGPEAARQAGLAVVAQGVWQAACAGTAHEPASTAVELTPAEVLAALCQVQINSLAIVPAERASAADRLGLAVYPVAGLLNHTCAPSLAVRFEGTTLVVRSLRPLAAGEPALHCYGPQVGEMIAQQRQRLLQQQYHFQCSCSACSDAGACAAEAGLAGLRCPAGAGGGCSCDGAVLPAGQVPAGVLSLHAMEGGSRACSKCSAILSEEDWEARMLPALRQAATSYAAAMEALDRLGPAASTAGVAPVVRVLREVLRQRQQLLHPRNQLLGQTHDALARAWNAAGAAQPAAQHLRHSLTSLQRAYPPGSTAVAFQQRQLAVLLQAVAASGGSSGEEAAAEAAHLLTAAAETLDHHFGAQVATRLLQDSKYRLDPVAV